MKNNKYKVILTNGHIQDKYIKYANNEQEAIILAQAEAIQDGKGYYVVSVEEVE